MKWPEVKFESLYAVPSRNGIYKPKEFHGRGCRIVNMGELFGFDFISNQEMSRLELSESELAVSSLEDGDLLFGRRSLVEAGAGKCSIVTDPPEPLTFESSLIRVRVNKETVNPRFLYYYFSSPQGRGSVRSIVSGATVKGIRGSDLKELPVPKPSSAIQDNIASTLSVYDDLIENNRRRMVLLEESARLLYREWFVRLRFPGHEHTRIVDGVPEGWDSFLIDELCDVGRGASPRPIAKFMDGVVPWFKIGDATSSDCPFIFRTQELVTEDGAKKSVHLDPGSIILSNSATCGIPYFTGISGCIHDGWLYFQNIEKVSKWFLYCYLFFKRNELVSSVGDGSTQKNLNTSAVGRLKLVIPSSEGLLRQFDEMAAANFEAINNLSRQTASLRAARDLLLPHLMSGEIAV